MVSVSRIFLYLTGRFAQSESERVKVSLYFEQCGGCAVENRHGSPVVGADQARWGCSTRRAAERGVVLGGGLSGGGFAPNAMDRARLHREVVEERALCHPEVGVVVVGRHAALVAPPQLGGAPVRLGHRRSLVRELRALAAGK